MCIKASFQILKIFLFFIIGLLLGLLLDHYWTVALPNVWNSKRNVAQLCPPCPGKHHCQFSTLDMSQLPFLYSPQPCFIIMLWNYTEYYTLRVIMLSAFEQGATTLSIMTFSVIINKNVTLGIIMIWHYVIAIMLCVTFYLLLCWVSLCWMSWHHYLANLLIVQWLFD